MTKAELKQEIQDRFNHFYRKTSGLLDFPNNVEGDLLRMCNLYLFMPESTDTKALEKGLGEIFAAPDMLDAIKSARDAIATARDMECTCSGFVRQYEGCLCKRAHALEAAEKHFWNLVGSL